VLENVKTTSFPCTFVLRRPVSAQSGCCGCVAFFARSKLYLTSAGVIVLPSLHFTFLRIVITYVDFVFHVPLVASHGMNLSWSGSYRNGVS
jgi:hypothetical protein